MEYAIIIAVSFCVSLLTLFSGFGLGTLLMPAFAIFFTVPAAIAATAVVHLANNIFKAILLGKKADLRVTLLFALPAAAAAILGALLLNLFAAAQPLYQYAFFGPRQITALKLVISALILIFAILEIIPRLAKIGFGRKWIPLGGLLSGFFGGLSGHQGALRSAFLIKAGLDKEEFIATAALSAIVVDVVRIIVYGFTFLAGSFNDAGAVPRNLILTAIAAAFAGAYLAKHMMKKVTFRSVQMIIAILLAFTALGLGSGLL
ncbi:MAG: hypothetical protein A2Y07_00550 [Planctomycetes bacterium GWF2_50_10]|nr:MAG: hypothetical protein A2Y07_00550 [Planctomycetes bacterium GWF2_50_10]